MDGDHFLKIPLTSPQRPIRRPILLTVFFFLAAGMLVSGCTSRSPKSETIPLSFFDPEVVEVIKPGDILDIKFLYSPEFDRAQTVRADGKISLVFFQGLDVGGMTPDELHQKLLALYSEHLVDPEITVAIQKKTDRYVYVTGEVSKGGKLPVTFQTTVGQILAQSDVNYRRAAIDSVILVRRQSNSQYYAYVVDADFEKDSGRDIYVSDGDILIIPANTITHVGNFIQQYVRDLIPPQMSIFYGITYESNRNE
jgi:protein involved in polysaccharide export with SLBB domain